MNCEEGSPKQAKFAMQSGRPAAACGTKQCATGGFTFPCFFALFCVKSVTQVAGCTLTMWHISLRGLWKKMLPSEREQVHILHKR